MGGEYKVAQYGQWDGYPSGQGKTILTFLRSVDIADFRRRVATITEISEEELGALWKACGGDDSGFVTLDVSKKMTTEHPEFSRDTGAKILDVIMQRDALQVRRDIEFAQDSLFCEWAYVIDLDTNTLEVYKGFQKAPLAETERFYTSEIKEGEYFPVRQIATYPLNALPTEEEFLALEKDDDEDKQLPL